MSNLAVPHAPVSPDAEHGADHHGAGHDEHAHVHVVPLSNMLLTFAALIILTIVTVVASELSLGAAEIWISMGIATTKAVLVALYFMHLRYDKPFNALLLIFSLVFAALFISLSLVDSRAYQPEIKAYSDQNAPLDPAAEGAAPTEAPPAEAAPAQTGP